MTAFVSRRFVTLPTHLRLLIRVRLASSAAHSHPYPYPTAKHPTPHQIFHLPPGAAQNEVKARYYELVRIHHPDSPHARAVPPHICRARFQAITAAYDMLRGKARHMNRFTAPSYAAPGYPWPAHGRGRHYPRAQYAGYNYAPLDDVDDRMKDRLIMVIGLAAIAFGFAPLMYMSPGQIGERRHRTASQHLAEARRDAREFGAERRSAIRRRVRADRVEVERRAQKDAGRGDALLDVRQS